MRILCLVNVVPSGRFPAALANSDTFNIPLQLLNSHQGGVLDYVRSFTIVVSYFPHESTVYTLLSRCANHQAPLLAGGSH